MNELKKGALLSYISILLVNTVGLFITPFIIKSLGKSEYGLYSLIGSFIAYLSLMDLGLNNTIVRFVSKFQAEKDKSGESQFLGTIMSIYFLISLILVLIGVVAYLNLQYIFKNSLLPSQIKEAKIMFLILLFDLGIALPSGSFLAISTAYGKFTFAKSVGIARYVLRTITVVAILSLGGKAIALVTVDTTFNILVVLVSMYYCFKTLQVKFSFKERSKKIIRQIFGYSVWIFLVAIIQTFQWNAGQIILGMHVRTEIIAIFSVGLMLGGYFGAFAGVINTLLLPKAAQMLTNNAGPQELTDIMIRVGRINSFICFLILSNFILFGKTFLTLWIGNSFGDSWVVACIIMAATFIPLTQSFGNSILEIKNRIKPRAIGMLLSTTTAILFSLYFVTIYGIYGVIIPIAVGMFINSAINNYLYVKNFGFLIKKFYKDTFLYQLVLTILILIVSYLLKNRLPVNSWLSLIIACGVFSAVYVLLFKQLILNKHERQMIFRR